ncbi:unnamed protein product [Diamesa serratosioi]
MDVEHQHTTNVIAAHYMNNNKMIRAKICEFSSTGQTLAATPLDQISYYFGKKCQIYLYWKESQHCYDDEDKFSESYNIITSFDVKNVMVKNVTSITFDDCILFDHRKKSGLNITIQTILRSEHTTNTVHSEMTMIYIPSDEDVVKPPQNLNGAYKNGSYELSWEKPETSVEIIQYKLFSCDRSKDDYTCNSVPSFETFNATILNATIKSDSENKKFAIVAYSKNSQSFISWPKCNKPLLAVTSTSFNSVSSNWILNCEYIYKADQVQLFISRKNDTHFDNNCTFVQNDIYFTVNQTEYTFKKLASGTRYYIGMRVKLSNETCKFIDKIDFKTINYLIYLVITFGILYVIVLLFAYYTCECLGNEVDYAINNKELKKLNIEFKIEQDKNGSKILRVIKESQLKLGSRLGKGHFGCVFIAEYHNPESKKVMMVAVKILTVKSELCGKIDLMDKMLSEAFKMCLMNDVNILHFIGISFDESRFMIVTEIMPEGDLETYIAKNKDDIGSIQLLTWALQIINGLIYISGKKEFHGDLATRNILVRNEKQVVIADFGMANIKNIDKPTRTSAPEIRTGGIFTTKSDIWSLGVLLFEMFCFGAEGDVSYGERMINIANIFMYAKPKEIIKACMVTNPDDRRDLPTIRSSFFDMLLVPSENLIIYNDALKNSNYTIRTKLINEEVEDNGAQYQYEPTENSRPIPADFKNVFKQSCKVKSSICTKLKKKFCKKRQPNSAMNCAINFEHLPGTVATNNRRYGNELSVTPGDSTSTAVTSAPSTSVTYIPVPLESEYQKMSVHPGPSTSTEYTSVSCNTDSDEE